VASLDGPQSKIKRAKKHSDEFEAIVDGLVFCHEEHPHVIGIEHDPQTGKEVYKPFLIPEVPCDVAPIAVDALGCLPPLAAAGPCASLPTWNDV
jgi:hypothetical protein